MSRVATFQFDLRPDYGFDAFDRLLGRLRNAIADVGTGAEVLAALRLEGRDVDAKQLATELNLDLDIAEIVAQLAAFGDEGDWVHAFGAVCIARINAGSLVSMCDATTYVFAIRTGSAIEYRWWDENDGTGYLGVRDRPLSLIEAIEMVDAVLRLQAPYDVGDDWRSGYLTDDSMVVQVSSTVYEQLRTWYDRAVIEWLVSHGSRGQS